MFYLWKATIFPQANTVLESYYLPLTTVCVVCRLPRCYVMHARNFLALFPEDALRAMREKALAFSNPPPAASTDGKSQGRKEAISTLLTGRAAIGKKARGAGANAESGVGKLRLVRRLRRGNGSAREAATGTYHRHVGGGGEIGKTGKARAPAKLASSPRHRQRQKEQPAMPQEASLRQFASRDFELPDITPRSVRHRMSGLGLRRDTGSPPPQLRLPA